MNITPRIKYSPSQVEVRATISISSSMSASKYLSKTKTIITPSVLLPINAKKANSCKLSTKIEKPPIKRISTLYEICLTCRRKCILLNSLQGKSKQPLPHSHPQGVCPQNTNRLSCPLREKAHLEKVNSQGSSGTSAFYSR